MDLRRVPGREGAARVRVRAHPGVARPRPALLGPAGPRLLRELRLRAGPRHDEPPLRPRLRRAALDRREGPREGGVPRAGAGGRAALPRSRGRSARVDLRRDRAGARGDEGARRAGLPARAARRVGPHREGVPDLRRGPLRRGHPLPGRALPSVHVPPLRGRAPRVRSRARHRLLRRRPGQLHVPALRPRRRVPSRLRGRQGRPHEGLVPLVGRGRAGGRAHLRHGPPRGHRSRAHRRAAALPARRGAPGPAPEARRDARARHRVPAPRRGAAADLDRVPVLRRELLQGAPRPARGAAGPGVLPVEGRRGGGAEGAPRDRPGPGGARPPRVRRDRAGAEAAPGGAQGARRARALRRGRPVLDRPHPRARRRGADEAGRAAAPRVPRLEPARARAAGALGGAHPPRARAGPARPRAREAARGPRPRPPRRPPGAREELARGGRRARGGRIPARGRHRAATALGGREGGGGRRRRSDDRARPDDRPRRARSSGAPTRTRSTPS